MIYTSGEFAVRVFITTIYFPRIKHNWARGPRNFHVGLELEEVWLRIGRALLDQAWEGLYYLFFKSRLHGRLMFFQGLWEMREMSLLYLEFNMCISAFSNTLFSTSYCRLNSISVLYHRIKDCDYENRVYLRILISWNRIDLRCLLHKKYSLWTRQQYDQCWQ